MNVPSITSQSQTPAVAALFAAQQTTVSASTLEADRLALAKTASEGKPSAKPAALNDPAAVKKAASQFEAIIIRQLLAPSIEPIMSGGLGGDTGGNGVYAYMLTDTLADSLSKGGGMGLAQMLEKQLSPHPSPTDIIHSSSLLKHSTNTPTP